MKYRITTLLLLFLLPFGLVAQEKQNNFEIALERTVREAF